MQLFIRIDNIREKPENLKYSLYGTSVCPYRRFPESIEFRMCSKANDIEEDEDLIREEVYDVLCDLEYSSVNFDFSAWEDDSGKKPLEDGEVDDIEIEEYNPRYHDSYYDD